MRKIKLLISSLAHDGRGMGFVPSSSSDTRGKAVFVSGALPGMTITCSVTRDRGNYLEAETQGVENCRWQAERTCPHMPPCGGCPLLPMPYDLQLQWKEKLVQDAMLRIGRINESDLSAIWRKPLGSPQLSGFRNKVELAFGQYEGNTVLGFRKRQSHEVFPLENCLLLPGEAQKIIDCCSGLARSSGLAPFLCAGGKGKKTFSGFWRFLILRKGISPGGDVWHAMCVTSPGGKKERKFVANMGRQLLEAFPTLASFVHEERKSGDMLPVGQKRITCLDSLGKENPNAATLQLSLGSQLFTLDTASFFQVNEKAASLLCGLALEFDDLIPQKDKASLLDLYCGVGAPGQLLAPRYARLSGVENDWRAIRHARKNAQSKGFSQCVYEHGDAGKIAAKLETGPGQSFDTVLLDPPRSGLNAETLAAVLRISPKSIIYISCNPATLARDARLLGKRYEPLRLDSVDLFPHTPHMECCGIWRKRSL